VAEAVFPVAEALEAPEKICAIITPTHLSCIYPELFRKALNKSVSSNNQWKSPDCVGAGVIQIK